MSKSGCNTKHKKNEGNNHNGTHDHGAEKTATNNQWGK